MRTAVLHTGNPGRRSGQEPGSGWASYHIFHHGSLDLLLLDLVLPVLRELRLRDRLRRFFFIRYGLGGPHIRLRLFGAPADREEAACVLERRAAEFFARRPSTSPLDERAIREQNRRLLEHDPDGIDAVYPDNSLVELPFRPEVERYGGERLIERSLELFALSSACALALLETHASEPRSRFLAAVLRALLRQALGFAADPEELARLVAFASPGDGGPPLLIDRADREFERQPDSYVQLVAEEIESACSPDPPRALDGFLLTEASRRLDRHLQGASAPVRWRAASSHIHMTANRLGLKNAEEVYLGRILWRAARQVSISDPSLCQRLRETVRTPEGSPDDSLETLIPPSFEQLFASPPGGPA
jgi:hypothetical protein